MNINCMSHLTQYQTTQILNKFKLQTNLSERVLQLDFKKTKYTMWHTSSTKICLIWLCKVQKQYKLRYYAKCQSKLDIQKSGSSTEPSNSAILSKSQRFCAFSFLISLPVCFCSLMREEYSSSRIE